jgi:hypothetical protein
LAFSEETLLHEVPHAGKLDNKHRGELAELAFMRKAATLGFAVAKPWGDCDRYDVIVRFGKIFWRVQIKSVLATATSRPHYRVRTVGRTNVPYTPEEIDFLVAYIFPKDTWYVFPASVFEKSKALYIRPGPKRSPLEQYREAWNLMGPVTVESAPVESAAGAAAGR